LYGGSCVCRDRYTGQGLNFSCLQALGDKSSSEVK
jgi:hypothetical protein